MRRPMAPIALAVFALGRVLRAGVKAARPRGYEPRAAHPDHRLFGFQASAECQRCPVLGNSHNRRGDTTYGYRTLADVLEAVRGFYITYDRYQSYIGVRGFGRLGDWNSRILLLVDGHRINDNVLGQAFIGLEFPVDIDLIQRIEIIRGPSSSLYGAEAFFAVINVITRKENQPKREEISFAAGSFGSYGGRATWDRRIQRRGLRAFRLILFEHRTYAVFPGIR